MRSRRTLGLRARVALIPSPFVATLAAYYLGGWQPRARLNEAALLDQRTRRVLQSAALGVQPHQVQNDRGTVHEVLANLESANSDWRHLELRAPDGRLLYPLVHSPPPQGPNLRSHIQAVELRGTPIAELRVVSDPLPSARSEVVTPSA